MINNALKKLCNLSTVAVLLSCVACAVEAPGTGAGGESELKTHSFAVSDASNSSFATVTIRSDDPAELALGSDDFELIAITAEQAAAEAAEAVADEGAEAEGEVEEEGLDEGLNTDLSDEVLADGVVALELVERAAPDYRAPFRDRYYYGRENGKERTASVTRQTAWHRVYVSIYQTDEEDGEWGTLLSNVKLKNKQTVTKDGSKEAYQMRVKVRARKTKHYYVEFSK